MQSRIVFFYFETFVHELYRSVDIMNVSIREITVVSSNLTFMHEHCFPYRH